MYNKKYILKNIDPIGGSLVNPVHATILGKTCYIAYLNVNERGWFLCEVDEDVHRIHTSEIKDVRYIRGNRIIVYTRNTKYVFEVILDGKEN